MLSSTDAAIVRGFINVTVTVAKSGQDNRWSQSFISTGAKSTRYVPKPRRIIEFRHSGLRDLAPPHRLASEAIPAKRSTTPIGWYRSQRNSGHAEAFCENGHADECKVRNILRHEYWARILWRIFVYRERISGVSDISASFASSVTVGLNVSGSRFQ